MDCRKVYEKEGWSFILVPIAPTYSRYYVRRGAVTKFNRGFRTRTEVDEWIESFGDMLEEQDAKILRIKFKDDPIDIFIVRRNGEVYER